MNGVHAFKPVSFASWVATTLAFGVIFLGCESASQSSLVVSLQTDLVAGHEFAEVELTLLPTDGEGATRRVRLQASPGEFVEMAPVQELENLNEDDYRLRVTLLDAKGIGLTVRPALVALRGHTAVGLRITRSCLEVDCGDEAACLDGQCVDLRCSVEKPEFCNRRAGCETEDDCVVGASCAVASCEEGICWAEASSSDAPQSCGTSAWCHPESGCTAIGQVAAEASCDDAKQNGFEEGVDCGGPCDRCIGLFRSTVADSCIDGEQTGAEEGIDCGGGCTPCAPDDFCDSQAAVPVHECLALRALCEANDPNVWVRSRGWFTDSDLCGWDGITCTDGHVTALVEPNNGLTGTIPPELANLRMLTEFRLDARLTGTIPPELGLLSELVTLDLYDNALEGTIPPELGQLPRLATLILGVNQLTGGLPIEQGSFPALDALFVNSNALGGTLPEALTTLTRLTDLGIQRNAFEGTLPAFLGEIPNLVYLQAHDNRFTGPIPETLGNLTGLYNLELHNNQLSGTVPAWLATPALEYIRLDGNQLEGAIPQAFASVGPGGDFRRNACIWAEDCATEAYLDTLNTSWRDTNTAEDCAPPIPSCP